MQIQSISQNNSSTSFGAHLPRTFAGVMNYMYKNANYTKFLHKKMYIL